MILNLSLRILMSVAVTILVIDDDPLILELLPDVLKSNSYNVVTASTLADAHAIMKQAHIDLILCDVPLPEASKPINALF